MSEIQPSVATVRRANWLDYDKGITIIFVVFNHCICKLFVNPSTGITDHPFLLLVAVFLYGFRMPLFFMAAGILLNNNLQKKGLPSYLGTRVDLLYAMVVWGVIQVSLRLLAHTPLTTYWTYLDLFINPRKVGHLWYLNTFFCICVVYSLMKIKLRLSAIQQVFVGLVLYCIASAIMINNLNGGILTDIFKFYFFFAIGNAICVWISDKTIQQRLCSWKLFCSLFIAFISLQYYCTRLNLQHGLFNEGYVEGTLPFLYLVQGLVGCAFSISLSFLLEKYNQLLWLPRVGRYSFYIYLSHMLFISLEYNILRRYEVMLYTPALLIILWIMAVLSPIVLYNLCVRFNFRWLFSLYRLKPLEKRKVISVPVKEKMDAPVIYG